MTFVTNKGFYYEQKQRQESLSKFLKRIHEESTKRFYLTGRKRALDDFLINNI